MLVAGVLISGSLNFIFAFPTGNMPRKRQPEPRPRRLPVNKNFHNHIMFGTVFDDRELCNIWRNSSRMGLGCR